MTLTQRGLCLRVLRPIWAVMSPHYPCFSLTINISLVPFPPVSPPSSSDLFTPSLHDFNPQVSPPSLLSLSLSVLRPQLALLPQVSPHISSVQSSSPLQTLWLRGVFVHLQCHKNFLPFPTFLSSPLYFVIYSLFTSPCIWTVWTDCIFMSNFRLS